MVTFLHHSFSDYRRSFSVSDFQRHITLLIFQPFWLLPRFLGYQHVPVWSPSTQSLWEPKTSTFIFRAHLQPPQLIFGETLKRLRMTINTQTLYPRGEHGMGQTGPGRGGPGITAGFAVLLHSCGSTGPVSWLPLQSEPEGTAWRVRPGSDRSPVTCKQTELISRIWPLAGSFRRG